MEENFRVVSEILFSKARSVGGLAVFRFQYFLLFSTLQFFSSSENLVLHFTIGLFRALDFRMWSVQNLREAGILPTEGRLPSDSRLSRRVRRRLTVAKVLVFSFAFNRAYLRTAQRPRQAVLHPSDRRPTIFEISIPVSCIQKTDGLVNSELLGRNRLLKFASIKLQSTSEI